MYCCDCGLLSELLLGMLLLIPTVIDLYDLGDEWVADNIYGREVNEANAPKALELVHGIT